MLSPADGDLRDIRNEVIRYALRIFTDKSRRMGSYRIKVSEKDYIPRIVCGMDIGKYLLNHAL